MWRPNAADDVELAKIAVRSDAGSEFSVRPIIYTDPKLFELELERIFEKTWIFLGLESQLREAHSYFTCQIGRAPILVSRDGAGKIQAFYNMCRHKGAVICRSAEGNSRIHVCPYHHWSYGSDGRSVGIKDKGAGGYTKAFLDQDHGLKSIARISSYNGLIFGSLTDDVPSLEEFLGDMRFFIDLIMDQGPNGMERIPGRAPYFYRGNWKLQADNGIDLYHVTSTHISLLALQGRKREADNKTVRSTDWMKRERVEHHCFSFPYGHAALVMDPVERERSPIFPHLPEIAARLGDERAEAMLYGLQLHIFPNLQLANSIAPVLRTFQPIAVDQTSIEVMCLGAIGETREDRSLRLRQFEDFFNATGLASPDDATVYEDVQRGLNADADSLQGFARGEALAEKGANARARAWGLTPIESVSGEWKMASEINLQSSYRQWARMMKVGSEEMASA